MASDKPADQYEEVFEEGDVPKEAQTVHRIRANSTIMQLNKILGQSHSHSIKRRNGLGVRLLATRKSCRDQSSLCAQKSMKLHGKMY